MSKNKTAARCGKLLTVLGLCFSLGFSAVTASADMMAGQGDYYSDFKTLEELQEAAADLGQQIAEEGITMLKNKDGALPLEGNEWVSVFGVTSDSLIGGSETVAEALESTGFRVNQTLVRYYEATDTSSGGQMMGPSSNSEVGNEKTEEDFSESVKSSLNLYGDLGVIVLSRDGAEGSDLVMKTDEVEDNKYKGEDQGWEHKDLYKETTGEGDSAKTVEYKHYLQLTESEEELIAYVESVCEKVVVVLNTSNVLECKNLQNDDEIDGIFWIGRTGDNGLSALGKILNGTLSPSGRTVDVWTADHTADPTWINYATGEQVDNVTSMYEGAEQYYVAQDSSGNHNRFYQKTTDADGNVVYREYTRGTNDVSATDGQAGSNPYRSGPDMFEGYAFTMYEEGIYMGYRYYETAAAEAEAGNYDGFDYDEAVVYPFGYGLSYTTFDWEIVSSDLSDWGKAQTAYTNGGTLSVSVKVTNTGAVAGKDVVQVYAHAPYIDGEVEKSEVVLIGFAKTDELLPGASQTVTVEVNVQDIASFDDYDKNDNEYSTYELDAGGGYELRLQTDSHNVKKDASGEEMIVELSDLTEDIILDVDDYSGNTVEALFSETDDSSLYEEYNSLGYDPATQKNLKEEGKFVELSRGDFAGTFPDAHTMEEMSRSDEWFAWAMGRDLYVADTSLSVADGKKVQTIDQYGYAEDESDGATNQQPWVKKASEFTGEGAYAGWTQAASADAQDTDSEDWIMYYDMRGIDPYSDEEITEGIFEGLTGIKAWEKFMNQLTWQELIIVVSNITEKELESVGAPRTPANDSPKNLSSSYDWGDECHIAATFNPDLTYQMGVIVGNVSLLKDTGWYGPAMNTHRTAFGGRNNEYYSEDGFLAGTMAAAAVQGAQSKGCATYIKHFAMNDQETGRVRCSSIATEQTARELYLKPFQIAIQEGNSQHLMCSMGSIGDILFGTNYQAMTALLRDEWGFTGMTATDAYSPQVDSWPIDLMVRSGMDAALGDADTTGEGATESKTYLVSGEWDSAKNTVVLDGEASYTQWYNVRTSAMRILYANVNSNYVKNGIDLSGFKDQTLTAATQGVSYEADISLAGLTADTVEYTLQSGSLPAGLTLSDDGKISGTPTEAGTSTFTVQLLAENYLSATANFTITVASAFTVDTDMTKLEKGEEVVAYIESDVFKVGTGDGEYESVEYTLTEGALPAGLTLDNDLIEGTPTETGTFEVTIHVKATKASSGGSGGFPGGGFPGGGFPGMGGGTTSSSTELDFKLTIVVSGEETAPIAISEDGYWVIYGEKTQVKAEAEVPTISIDATTKHWVINGVDTGIVAEGKDGADGADGEDGAAGGCGSSVGLSVGGLGIAAAALAAAAFVAISRKKRNN